jgi:hypothetical protein
MAVSSNGTMFVGGANAGYIRRSMDNGKSWMPTTDGGMMIVAGVSGKIFTLSDRYFGYSADSLNTWSTYDITESIPELRSVFYPSDPVLYSFAEVNNNFFCGTFNGVVMSAYNSASWKFCNQGLPLVGKRFYARIDNSGEVDTAFGYPTVSAILSNKRRDIFIGTDHGMYYWPQGSDHWAPFMQGMPSISISSLALDSSGYLYAGTTSGMVFKTATTTTGISGNQTARQLSWNLQQNYPNPFNPSTTISFTVPMKSHVSLKIFDVIGREASTLASEVLTAGTYQRQWNASGMPSGMYFYRLQAGTHTETKRLILLR